jgi:hypothetical protein
MIPPAPLLEFLCGFNLIQPFRDNGEKRYIRFAPISIVKVEKHHRVLVKENVVVAMGDVDCHDHERPALLLQPQYAGEARLMGVRHNPLCSFPTPPGRPSDYDLAWLHMLVYTYPQTGSIFI